MVTDLRSAFNQEIVLIIKVYNGADSFGTCCGEAIIFDIYPAKLSAWCNASD